MALRFVVSLFYELVSLTPCASNYLNADKYFICFVILSSLGRRVRKTAPVWSSLSILQSGLAKWLKSSSKFMNVNCWREKLTSCPDHPPVGGDLWHCLLEMNNITQSPMIKNVSVVNVTRLQEGRWSGDDWNTLNVLEVYARNNLLNYGWVIIWMLLSHLTADFFLILLDI